MIKRKVESMLGGSLPLVPIPLTTPEESEQAQPSPLRSGISATPSAGTVQAQPSPRLAQNLPRRFCPWRVAPYPQRPALRIVGAAKPFRSELSERRNEVRIARNPNEHDNASARNRRRRERPKLSTFSFPFSTQNAASPCSQASHHPTQSQLP